MHLHGSTWQENRSNNYRFHNKILGVNKGNIKRIYMHSLVLHNPNRAESDNNLINKTIKLYYLYIT